MDVKTSSQLNKKPNGLGNIPEKAIRTMEKDLAMLQGKGGSAKPGLEEKPKPAAFPSFQPITQLKKPVAPAPPEQLPVAEPAKKFDFGTRPAPVPPLPSPAKPVPAPAPAPLPSRPEPLKPSVPLPSKPLPLVKPTPVKPVVRPLKFALIGLVVLIVVAGLGGFFYWWNYLRVPPTALTHYECQNVQCLEIEGEGADQCQNNDDCAPVEPDVPESLIPVDETKTIELAIGEESSIFDEVKAISSQSQATSTFKRLLIKLVSQTEKKYADLDTIIAGLGIKLPISIQGENYTLFSYSQTQGNRLGLILDVAESSSLVQDLKNWEQTIIGDLAPFLYLLTDEPLLPFTETFQDNTYQGISIRYINFPNPDLSIDYAIVASKLVITTSRESMFAAIDALLSEVQIEGDLEVVSSCGGIVCFKEKFAQCEPATLTSKLTEDLVYYYEIIGPKDNLCEVKSKFTANPNPVWVDKEMVCKYDNKKNFETAVKDMSKCQGALYDLMTGI